MAIVHVAMFDAVNAIAGDYGRHGTRSRGHVDERRDRAGRT